MGGWVSGFFFVVVVVVVNFYFYYFFAIGSPPSVAYCFAFVLLLG